MCGLLLERKSTTIEEGPDRADAGFHAPLAAKPLLHRLDRHVQLGFDQRKEKILMPLELQPSRSPLPARRDRSRPTQPITVLTPTWNRAAA
jgi:hypothetical protein